MTPRFLSLAQVADELGVSLVQARSLVKNRDIPAIQVGGRNQWRVETSELESYIQRRYAANSARQTDEPSDNETAASSAAGE